MACQCYYFIHKHISNFLTRDEATNQTYSLPGVISLRHPVYRRRPTEYIIDKENTICFDKTNDLCYTCDGFITTFGKHPDERGRRTVRVALRNTCHGAKGN